MTLADFSSNLGCVANWLLSIKAKVCNSYTLYSAEKNFPLFTGDMSFQIILLIVHFTNWTGHNLSTDNTLKKITQDVLVRYSVIVSDHNAKLAGHFQSLKISGDGLLFPALPYVFPYTHWCTFLNRGLKQGKGVSPLHTLVFELTRFVRKKHLI